jgi:hypothetical protein
MEAGKSISHKESHQVKTQATCNPSLSDTTP